MRFSLPAFLTLLALLLASPARATEAGWALLRAGEQVVLVRHSNAVGVADPADFDIAKCATQRALSERGKQQAERMGALMAARAAPVERVLSSRYCRALDTARIAFESEPEPFPPLDKLSADPATAAQQDHAVIDLVRGYSGSGLLVLVTHRENIQALTGVDAREDEAVIVRLEGDALKVSGRVLFN